MVLERMFNMLVILFCYGKGRELHLTLHCTVLNVSEIINLATLETMACYSFYFWYLHDTMHSVGIE